MEIGVFASFPATTSNYPHGTCTLVGCLVALKKDHANLFALLNMLFSRITFHLVLAGKTV